MQSKQFVDWEASKKYVEELFISIEKPINNFLHDYPGLVCDREVQYGNPRIMLRFHMDGSTASRPILIPRGGVRGTIDHFVHELCKETRLFVKDSKRGGVAMFYLLKFSADSLIFK
jgi:hypothetical protein